MDRSSKRKNVSEAVADAVESENIRITDHAAARMRQQKVFWFELKDVLTGGRHVPRKDDWSEEHNSWCYAIEGETFERRMLRVPVAFLELDEVLVVTVIELHEGSTP